MTELHPTGEPGTSEKPSAPSADTRLLLETLLRRAPVGFAYFDDQLRFVLLNDLLAEINGLPVEAHLGRAVGDVVPDMADENEALLGAVLRTGEPVIGVELTGETPARPGEPRDWLVNYYPVSDGGVVVGVGATVVEVTERNALLVAERAARLAAERAAERARRLHQFTAAVAGADDERSILAELAAAASELVGGAPSAVVSGPISAVEHLEPRGRARPVVVDREVVGVLVVQHGQDHEPAEWSIALDTAIDVAAQALLRHRFELLEREALAQQRTAALRAQLDAEHSVFEALQRAALPRALPEVEGLALEAHYRPAMEHVGIGGDWYDAFVLDDGRVGVCVADVAGHGVEAASLMAQLRNGLRAYAFEGLEPPEVLGRLDRLLRRLDTDLFATAVYGVVDAAGGSFEWANAGHPPPVRWDRRGATLLDHPCAKGPVLGWGGRADRRGAAVALAPDEGVVLFTDGLVERRGELIDAGLERLTAAVDRTIRRGEGVDVTSLVDEVRGPAEDDLCILRVARTRR